jgi:hypothetical protein
VTDEERDEALEVTRQVGTTLDTISNNLAKIEQYARRTRLITRMLILSLLIDVALTITIGFLASSSVSQSNAVRGFQVTSCNTNNQQKADQINLWTLIVHIVFAPLPGESAFEKAQAARESAELLDVVHKTYTPLKCPSVLYCL